MAENSVLPFNQRPRVVLYADPTALAVSFLESLVAGLTRALVISRKKDLWQKKIKHLEENKSIEIFARLPKKYFQDFSYVVFINSDEEEIPDAKSLQQRDRVLNLALEIAKNQRAKTLIVLPYLQNFYDQKLFLVAKDALIRRGSTIGIVCLGELFGPRVSLTKKGFVTGAIKGAISRKPLIIPENLEMVPTYVPDVAKELVKNLFSFGAMGETTLILSRKVSSYEFVNTIKKDFPITTFTEPFPQRDFSVPPIDHEILLKTSLNQAFKETVDWYTQYGRIPIEPTKTKRRMGRKIKRPSLSFEFPKVKLSKKVKKERKPRPWFWGTALLIGLIFSNPALLVTSASSLWFAGKQAISGKADLAQVALSLSSATATLAHREASIFQNVPLVERAVEPAINLAELLEKLSSLGNRGLNIQKQLTVVAQKALKGETYDVVFYSENLALELDFIYRELGFLQSELENTNGFTKKIIKPFLKSSDLASVRQKVLAGKQISESLPIILGNTSPVKYLVLFQNNMELRPTGGFIGSFALITFDRGKLIDINVSDVYEADGQLKGHIEPPNPIRDYLNEANWFLRDSNWDPDFPSSASTAEWFLEKEIGESVAGVLAVDLELAKSVLKEIGPIYLSDYKKTINSENLYEITQYEAEKDFFPGSQKKAGFLTALTRQLFDELINISPEKLLGVGETLINSLEEKHVQVFLHDKNAQRAFSDLGWDGGVYQPNCSGNCFADWLGIIDANVGVNKANYYIQRQSSLLVEIGEESVKKTLTVLIGNTANVGLGNDGIYKGYLRALASGEAKFSDIEIIGSVTKESKTPEITKFRGRREAGVFIEVLPGQTKSIVFSWEEKANLNFNQAGEYRLFWRKQAGTVADKITVQYMLPGGKIYSTDPSTLTYQADGGYTTTLTRDFSSRIFW